MSGNSTKKEYVVCAKDLWPEKHGTQRKSKEYMNGWDTVIQVESGTKQKLPGIVLGASTDCFPFKTVVLSEALLPCLGKVTWQVV